MANDTRSSRDIERDIEQERAELRGTIDELLGRLTFEDAWERLGAYLRENRTEYGYTLRRMIQEKPIPLMLTAVGVGWLLFDRTVSHAQGPGRDDDREAIAGPFSRSRVRHAAARLGETAEGIGAECGAQPLGIVRRARCAQGNGRRGDGRDPQPCVAVHVHADFVRGLAGGSCLWKLTGTGGTDGWSGDGRVHSFTQQPSGSAATLWLIFRKNDSDPVFPDRHVARR